MDASPKKTISRRQVGDNVWLGLAAGNASNVRLAGAFAYQIFESEEAVGQAMFDELVAYSREKRGDITMVLLGGRGSQAMFRVINRLAGGGGIDSLLGRLNVFTQDALAPMRMANGLSFVRDFERLLGPSFFSKVKSFTAMQTETNDLEGQLSRYVERLDSLGGIDLFFLGFGPEDGGASHLCYIKPGSGAEFGDFAGMIPISSSILEHHIAKFKAGGSDISEADEAECRNARYILTLGPAAILGAKKIIQSIVDASTAPAKRTSFKRLLDTRLAGDESGLARQVDANPGLLVRLHPDVKTFILPDLL